jgi:adenosylcobyric acid synthase
MPAKALMLQGTGSHVGKSLLTAALCRIFTQDGFRVLPFKAQNMSNNADVTEDGGEMGRAQAEQARACGVAPSVLMNPILLKPTTDLGAQVIVLGRATRTMDAQAYQAFKPTLHATVRRALEQLMAQADILVIEGAGSPAEINLKEGDFANMWLARHARAKVLLVGNIDWGGVFAQLVGTMELLTPAERRLVRGFLINKFRGDETLLASGIRWLERRCARPVLGTIPYLQDVELLEEDSVPLPQRGTDAAQGRLRIEVARLPRISNFTDVAPLAREPDVQVRYIDRPPADGSLPDGLILPGSKSTMADLAFVRARGLDQHLHRCVEAEREVVGVCGGFQMLGRRLLDPSRLEAGVEEVPGLGVLPMTTVFERKKTVAQVQGIHLASGLPVAGFEIHLGRMREEASSIHPVFRLTRRGDSPEERGCGTGGPQSPRWRAPASQRGAAPGEGDGAGEYDDGLRSSGGTVWGTYVHGLFEAEGFRRWWLNRLRRRRGLPTPPPTPPLSPDGVYDRLAQAVRAHLDLKMIYHILGV